MPSRYKYYSDGTIIKSFAPIKRDKRCTNHFFVSQFPELVKNKLDGSGWILPDGSARDSSGWVDDICKLYQPVERRPKSYSITSAIRRKISSSTAKMALNKAPGENLLFITLTFSQAIDERQANICWSKFVENLKKNYALTGYIGVKELHKSGVPHYHCILRMPFQPLDRLNDAWVHTWPDGFKYSNCALRTDKKKGAKVTNIRRAVAYCTKYMTKNAQEGVKYAERCHFIDHSSIDTGTYCSEQLINFIFEMGKCEKSQIFIWKHPEFPTVISTLLNFYHLHEEILQTFTDTFT